jgi:hypothetical protein
MLENNERKAHDSDSSTDAPCKLHGNTEGIFSPDAPMVMAELSDKNVEVLRHVHYFGRTETVYRTTDGKRPDHDSIAVRCGIVRAMTDEDWSALSENRNGHWSAPKPKAQSNDLSLETPLECHCLCRLNPENRDTSGISN